MKLTKPQMELLRECQTTCVRSYRPAQRLVDLGLAVWISENDQFDTTEAGRSALSQRGTE